MFVIHCSAIANANMLHLRSAWDKCTGVRLHSNKCFIHSILNNDKTEHFEEMDANELCRKVNGSIFYAYFAKSAKKCTLAAHCRVTL